VLVCDEFLCVATCIIKALKKFRLVKSDYVHLHLDMKISDSAWTRQRRVACNTDKYQDAIKLILLSAGRLTILVDTIDIIGRTMHCRRASWMFRHS
jgi:hypothetical protein